MNLTKHGAAVLYVLAVLAANYTATWFFPLPVFGQVAVGTLIFGVVFTLRDRMHRNGRRYVYTVIGITAALMFAESMVLGVPMRIIIASLIAIVLSETTDTEVYQRFIKRTWYARVAISNAVSIPVDSIIFNVVAFAGVFSPAMLVSIIFGEIVFKALASGGVALWKSSTATQPTSAPPISQ